MSHKVQETRQQGKEVSLSSFNFYVLRKYDAKANSVPGFDASKKLEYK